MAGQMDYIKAAVSLLSGSKMRARDTVRGKMGTVAMMVNGVVHNLGNTTKFEPKSKIETEDLPILGKVEDEAVSGSMSGSFSLEHYQNTSIFQEILQIYQDTGYWPEISFLITMFDPRSSAGANITQYSEVVFDETSLPGPDVSTTATKGTVTGKYGHMQLLSPNKPIPGVW